MPDTIVAQSSAPGPALAGLIRLSGPRARDIGRRLVGPADRRSRPSKPLTVRGAFRSRLAPPLPPLPATVLWMPGPRTYTGEDTWELELPGHPALLDRATREAEAAGARRAEPGEFSHRAFASGRVSLLQAEGVAAAIAADGAAELAAADAVRGGKLAADVRLQRDAIVSLLGLVEAGIDFTDQEDVVAISPARLVAGLARVDAALDALRRGSTAASVGLPRVVLAGPPSAGKSTLFNKLLGRERTVTDASHHTTRDAIEEPLLLPDGRRVLLVDSPGGDTAPEADLLLWFGRGEAGCVDRPHLRIAAKADLGGGPTPAASARAGDGVAEEAVRLSAHTGEGLSTLYGAIQRNLSAEAPERSRAPALLARHRGAIQEAQEALAAAVSLCGDDDEALTHPELIAVTLTRGVEALASLTGELTPDDLIASVFATFCVGK